MKAPRRWSDVDPTMRTHIAFNRVIREVKRLEDALNEQADARARQATIRREVEREARKARRNGR